MTERKIDSSLYMHVRSVISRAQPLEYAIRAVRQSHPLEFKQLQELNGQLRQYWIDLGVTSEEIDKEDLLDFAWDTLQVGFPLTRRHGRHYEDKAFVRIVHQGLANVRQVFGVQISKLAIPATRYFRICDLLNGNDVPHILSTVARCLKDAREFRFTDQFELEEFVTRVREPIPLHPGLHYVADESERDGRSIENFGFVLDTEMEFSIPELKRQIREFLYQYAARRKSLQRELAEDPTAHALIEEFLREDLQGHEDETLINRPDGFMSILSGLYCWDRYQHYVQQETKPAMQPAIEDTLGIYPKEVREVSYEAIRKNYYTTKAAIEGVKFSIRIGGACR